VKRSHGYLASSLGRLFGRPSILPDPYLQDLQKRTPFGAAGRDSGAGGVRDLVLDQSPSRLLWDNARDGQPATDVGAARPQPDAPNRPVDSQRYLRRVWKRGKKTGMSGQGEFSSAQVLNKETLVPLGLMAAVCFVVSSGTAAVVTLVYGLKTDPKLARLQETMDEIRRDTIRRQEINLWIETFRRTAAQDPTNVPDFPNRHDR
jgi:hypothetical protein